MKKLWLALLFAILGFAPARAQVIPQPSQQSVTGCVYNLSPPVLTTGQAGFIQCDANGRPITSPSTNISPYQFTSAGAGQYAISIAGVTTLTVPASSLIAEICIEGASARYTTTGTTPSSTVGIPVAAGGCFQLAGIADLNAFKIIGAGATMSEEFFK